MEGFPHNITVAENPDDVLEWTTVGETQNVPCEWVMFCELGMLPIKSTHVSSLIWFFDIIENRSRLDRQNRALQWDTHNGGGRMLRNQRQPVWCNPFSGLHDMTQSAGSLEGEGRVMAHPPNRSRSCAFQAEGKRTFSCVQQEGHVNEAIVTSRTPGDKQNILQCCKRQPGHLAQMRELSLADNLSGSDAMTVAIARLAFKTGLIPSIPRGD